MTIIWADSKSRDTEKGPVTEETFRDLAQKIDKSIDERLETNKTFIAKLGEVIGIYGLDDLVRMTSQIALIVASIAVVRTLGLH